MVDRNSSLELYKQIEQLLERDILLGAFGNDGCIGTHGALAERFNVSLITIRRAIKNLEDKGLVVVKQGKGTFVKGQPLKDDLYKLTALSSVISKNQKRPSVQIRKVERTRVLECLEEHIKKALGEECYLVERVHKVEKSIVGYAKLYIPNKLCSKFSRNELGKYSTYYLFENKLNIKLGKGIQYIRAEKASRDIARALKVEEGSPILLIERESYSDSNELIEFMQMYYEYYKYVLRVELNLATE